MTASFTLTLSSSMSGFMSLVLLMILLCDATASDSNDWILHRVWEKTAP